MSGNQLLEDGRPVVLHGEWVEAFPSAFPSQLQHVNKSCLHPYPLPSPPSRSNPAVSLRLLPLSLPRLLPVSLPKSIVVAPCRNQLLRIQQRTDNGGRTVGRCVFM